MEHRIHIFARQHQGLLSWTSVSTPWRDPIRSAGSSRAKVEKSFAEALRSRLAKMGPAERCEFPPTSSVYLVEFRLELTLKSDEGKREIHGRFPFIAEYRRFSAGKVMQLYHHPDRPTDRVVVEHGQQVTDVLRKALGKLWAELPDYELEALRCRGKERIEAMAFDAPVRGLREHVAELARERLGPGRPPPITSTPVRPPLVELKKVGVDLTHHVALRESGRDKPRPAIDRQISAMFTGAMASPTPRGPADQPWRVPPTTRSFAVVGPPGSGRSTTIERATELLLDHDGYALRRNLDQVSRVFRLSARTVLAGMSHLGEWEKRVLTLIEECRAHRVVLAFDDLMLLGSVGRSRESDRAFADVLEGPISRGEIAIWGETTPAGWMRLSDEAPRLSALLGRITLSPTEPEETAVLLFHRARQLERDASAFHLESDAESPSRARPPRLEIDPLTLPLLIQEARSLFSGVAEPQKSMHILGRLAARLTARDGRESDDTKRLPSPERLVLEVLGERTGMPLSLLDGSALDPAELERRFTSEIVGQPEAARAATDLALRLKTRLTDPKRPRAVYLLTGPTGTGKTETAKWIARHLYGGENRLVRFDMAEYAVPGSAARLLGGTGGALDGGLATRVREQPFSVVLLDEIEKADTSVLYLLLQLFDEGRLTDPSGTPADFGSATILMTSNLGARPEARAGFATDESHAREVMLDVSRAVRDFFPPELFHRIDRIVAFRPLDEGMARAIVRRELGRLLARRGLTERRIAVSATDAVVELALRQAFDPRRGARAVKGWLEDRVGTLLADAIAEEGRAEQRSLVVYVAHSRALGEAPHLAVYAERMTEAALTPTQLLPLPPTEDVPALRALLTRVAAPLLSLNRVEALREARRRTPATDRATIYALERAALDLEALIERQHALLEPEEEWTREAYEEDLDRERGRSHGRHVARGDVGPKALRDHLADLLSMRRALNEIEVPGAHVVDVLVTAVGEHAGVSSFALPLAASIARWAGELEEAYGRTRGSATRALPVLKTLSESGEPLLRVVMRVSGFGARARLASEVGTYVILADDAAPELLSVRVLSHLPERSLAEVFSTIDAAEVRFRAALEAGTELPEPPLPLLPRLRTLRIEHRVGDAIDLTIEDHRLGDVVTARGRETGDWLEPVHARLRLAGPDELDPTAHEGAS